MSEELDEADKQPEPDEAAVTEPVEERAPRGIGVIFVLAALGAAAGAVVGALIRLRDLGGTEGIALALEQGWAEGALIGALIGGSAGAMVWVVFPYKGKAQVPSQTPAEEGGQPGADGS